MDKKFGQSSLIDVKEIVDNCREKWVNFNLTEVNDCIVRLGVVKGEFHWHKHDHEDEFFYVIDGRLTIEVKDKTVELSPQQAFTVSRGVEHRTRAEVRTVMLMIEGSGIKPTGD